MSLMLLGILNSQAAGGGGAAYDLLETTTLATSASSVTFTGLGSYSDYAHLQIRGIAKSTTGGSYGLLKAYFNSDTSSNYSRHSLYFVSSEPASDSSTSSNEGFARHTIFGSADDKFTPFVIDILDFSNTSKNTTTRSLHSSSDPGIWFSSGLWTNTNAVTEIEIDETIANFIAGSRFSLYGIKGA